MTSPALAPIVEQVRAVVERRGPLGRGAAVGSVTTAVASLAFVVGLVLGFRAGLETAWRRYVARMEDLRLSLRSCLDDK
jgi:hypothetical protein